MAANPLTDIPIAPTLRPTLAAMDDIPRIVENSASVLHEFGAVLIEPPKNWQPPILRVNDAFKFAVRHQRMPWVLVSKRPRRGPEITEFEESLRTISLNDFRTDALKRDQQLWPRKHLLSSTPVGNVESTFWHVMENGMDGEPVELVYGIDIENNTDYGTPSSARSEVIGSSADATATDGIPGSDTVVGTSSSGNDVVMESKNSVDGESMLKAEVETSEGKKSVIEEVVLDSGHADEIPKAEHNESKVGLLLYDAKRNHRSSESPGPHANGSKVGNGLSKHTLVDEELVSGMTSDGSRPRSSVMSDSTKVEHRAVGAKITSPSELLNAEKREDDRMIANEGGQLATEAKVGLNAKVHVDGKKVLESDGHALSSNLNSESTAVGGERGTKVEAMKDESMPSSSVDEAASGIKAVKSDALASDTSADAVISGWTRTLVRPTKKRRVERKTSRRPFSATKAGSRKISAERNGPKVDPKSHIGNINQQGVLRHLPVMPGINKPMFYIGHIFTRFCWHVEDAFLNSMAYLHDGSAPKVWYSIPPDDAEKFEEYAAEIFGDSICSGRESASGLLKFKTAMFHPLQLMERGITVHRIVQKPRSFVVTAPRSYHCGFNCGFNISEAVNYASPRWFPMGRQAAEELRAIHKQLFVPHELLLYLEAVSLERQVQLAGLASVMANATLVTHATVISDELWKYIREGEAAVDKFKRGGRSKVVLWKGIENVASTHELGPEYGVNAGILCDVCDYTCHFYVAMCSKCKGNEKARCYLHFGRVCTRRDHKMVVVRRYEPQHLLHLLENVEKIAGKKVTGGERLDRLRLTGVPAYRLRPREPTE